jgi:hypothetical protein
MKTSNSTHNSNVIDLFTRKPYVSRDEARIIRLSLELDGMEMLYSNDANPERLFSLKILAWGLRANGEVVGLVPWLNDLIPCTDIHDPLHGSWEGYFDPGIDEVFFEPPLHKVIELETAAEYFDYICDNPDDIIQELPDTLGTHAVFSDKENKTLILQEIVSWRLHSDGVILGMLINPDKVQSTPVLPGDDCLYPAQAKENFRYFFQHHIANKIKSEDPEALAAMCLLVEDSCR